MGYSARQTALTVSVPLIALVRLVPSGGIASAEYVVLGDSSGQLIRDCSRRRLGELTGPRHGALTTQLNNFICQRQIQESLDYPRRII